MEFRIGELCRKEVIDVMDGSRYGYVGDAEIDLENGQVRALVVPGRLRLMGLLGREEDHIFPWAAIKHYIGGRDADRPQVRKEKSLKICRKACAF